MPGMFAGAESFNQDISGWNVSNVVNMEGMFLGAKSFSYSLNSWKVSENLEENVIFDEETGQKIPWWAFGHSNTGKYKPVSL